MKEFTGETPMDLSYVGECEFDKTFIGECKMDFDFEAVTEMTLVWPEDASMILEE